MDFFVQRADYQLNPRLNMGKATPPIGAEKSVGITRLDFGYLPVTINLIIL